MADKTDFKNEAKYYLELKEYDIDQAFDEYMIDLKSEKELQKAGRKKKNKKCIIF